MYFLSFITIAFITITFYYQIFIQSNSPIIDMNSDIIYSYII